MFALFTKITGRQPSITYENLSPIGLKQRRTIANGPPLFYFVAAWWRKAWQRITACFLLIAQHLEHEAFNFRYRSFPGNNLLHLFNHFGVLFGNVE